VANLLLVEDDDSTREAYALALQHAGYRVREAPHGQAALAALLAEPIDLIVLDLMMPVMDGVAFLEVIRSYARWRNLPVVIVTALAADDEDLVRRLTVARVFRKTRFAINELIDCARQLVPPPGNN
jgi:DNA-binding response OmpR family regulator